jgi:tetratricopeptide (TPR) repeat protein
MFELVRGLRRLFAADAPRRGARAGAETAPLEQMDMDLLRMEARAAEVAADRPGARNPSLRSLDAARAWRECARRTGDPAALRAAALAAERAVQGFKAQARIKSWAVARCEQALVAMLGAELYGDDGLNSAAEAALRQVVSADPPGAWSAVAAGQLARLSGRQALAGGGYDEAKAAAAAFDAPIAGLAAHLRSRSVSRGMLAELRCDRAEILIACAGRLRDMRLFEQAIADLDKLAARLDLASEPLALSRVQTLRASARVGLGETLGRIEDIAEGVELLVASLEGVSAEQSPLDWARLQHALANALQSLGEGSETDRAFEQALGCYGRALWATRGQPALTLRAVLSQNQAVCLARRAELAADLGLLDAAVQVLRKGLAKLDPAGDPVGWAIAQVNLAQLYVARLDVAGGDDDRAAAAMALTGAIDVFAEHGLRSLTAQAAVALETLRAR